jgi:N-acylneuraminate cytidylyltransferase
MSDSRPSENATNLLVVIPARGGSKGLQGKNIKLLNGKPLIAYSIEVARAVAPDRDICVSTDDPGIADTVRNFCGMDVPFIRPPELAADSAGSNGVILHALDYHEMRGKQYGKILLLQPTSPLRTIGQVREALQLYRPDCDMVVSVKQSNAAPALCVEDELGYLRFVVDRHGSGRQDYANYYEYNGAIYVINPKSLRGKGLSGFDRVVKYVMPAECSVDIDTAFDWLVAKSLLRNT